MKNYLPKKLISLAKNLSAPLYLVGGLVRDFLIDKKISNDVDITSALKVEEIVKVAKEKDIVVVGEYKRTGTAILFDGEIKYEFTSFRKDIYEEGGGHTPYLTIPTNNIIEDALRRDFKCNAVYYDIKNGEFVDPLGGIEDIKNKTISTVKDATEVFSHDGLRLMRLARLSAELNFKPDNLTILGAKENSDKIRDISVERILVELNKILSSDEKHTFSNKKGHYEGLKILDEIGVLDEILPELTLGRNMLQRSDYHNYDVLEHSLRSVLYAKKEIRLAMLLHDIGKPFCMQKFSKYHAHDYYGVEIANKILTRWKTSNKVKEQVLFIVKNHMLDMKEEMREIKIKRFIATNYAYINDLLDAKQADYSACKDDMSTPSTVIRWQNVIKKMKEEKVPFTLAELKIRGKDLIDEGIEDKKVGIILKELLDKCIEEPSFNERDKLIKMAQKKQKKG